MADEQREALDIVCPCGHLIEKHSIRGCDAYVQPRIGGSGACCTRTPAAVVLASKWLREERARVWDEAAEATADWMANNPTPGGVPVDPPRNPYDREAGEGR